MKRDGFSFCRVRLRYVSLHALMVVCALFVVWPCGVLRAQGTVVSFEGEIRFILSTKTPLGQQSQPARYYTSAKGIRVELGESTDLAVLALAATDEVLLITPAEQRYALLPLTFANLRIVPDAPSPDIEVKWTGEVEQIAGLSCEHVLVTRNSRTTDVCLTRHLGRYVNPLDALSGNTVPVWQQALAGRGFPLRIRTPDGWVSLEVTGVERGRPDEALFGVPPGYRRVRR